MQRLDVTVKLDMLLDLHSELHTDQTFNKRSK